MKNGMKSAFAFLLAAFVLTACSSDNTEFQSSEKPVKTEDTGFLAFSQEGLSVITDAEVVRATAVDTNDFICSIYNEEGGLVQQFTYGERPTSPIELTIGSYKMNIVSEESVPASEWEHPIYGAEIPFTIQKGETNTLETIKCKLRNIKVTVGYDADLFALLEEGSQTSVSVGDNKMEFGYTEERAAYFAALQEENSMIVEMSLNYAGKNSKMSATIDGVKGGQWRKITVNMPHANEGNAVFTITIETLTVDEEVVVDVAELAALSETIIPDDQFDPLAPMVTWEGHDLEEVFQLKASHFDEDGNCMVPVVFDVDANNSTFTSFIVNIKSTSNSFMESLESMNILTEFDICQVSSQTNANLNTALTMVGIPTGSKVLGKESVSVSLTNLMSILYEHEGTHTFTLTISNAVNHIVQQPIVMLVDKASEGGSTDAPAPTVEWEGYDIDQAYTITDDMTVKLNVKAEAGIKDLVIDIVSDLLTPEELAGAGLSAHFSLVNPESEDLAASLNMLGFPTGDDVKNQTTVSFDITSFMPVLNGISGDTPCYANFELTVTDNNGKVTKKVLKLLMNQ